MGGWGALDWSQNLGSRVYALIEVFFVSHVDLMLKCEDGTQSLDSDVVSPEN